MTTNMSLDEDSKSRPASRVFEHKQPQQQIKKMNWTIHSGTNELRQKKQAAAESSRYKQIQEEFRLQDMEAARIAKLTEESQTPNTPARNLIVESIEREAQRQRELSAMRK